MRGFVFNGDFAVNFVSVHGYVFGRVNADFYESFVVNIGDENFYVITYLDAFANFAGKNGYALVQRVLCISSIISVKPYCDFNFFMEFRNNIGIIFIIL